MDGFAFLILLGSLAVVAAIAMIVTPTRECSREPD